MIVLSIVYKDTYGDPFYTQVSWGKAQSDILIAAYRRITSQGQRDLDLIAGRIELDAPEDDFEAEE